MSGLNVRFINSFQECEDDDCTGFYKDKNQDDVVDADDAPYVRDVESYMTLDVWAAYTFEYEGGTTRLNFGVNNVLDRDPAMVYNGFLATSDANTYDFFGRYFYMKLGACQRY